MFQRYEKILVAYDGSKNATLAFEQAVTLASQNDADLIILQVVDTRIDPFAPYVIEGLLEERIAEAHEELDRLSEDAKRQNIKKVVPILREGSIRTIIATEVPEEFAIDLIIIGSTGKSGLDKLLIGSTTNYVTTHAKCPVLIVR